MRCGCRTRRRGRYTGWTVKTNTVTATIEAGKRPCSGLAAAFGSIWAPVCGDRPNVENGEKPGLARIDPKTNTVAAKIAVGIANSEGGLAASPEAIWVVSDMKGRALAHRSGDEQGGRRRSRWRRGRCRRVYAEGAVWVASPEKSVLTRVDAKTNKATDTIAVGRAAVHHGGRGRDLDVESGRRDGLARGHQVEEGGGDDRVRDPGTGGELAFGKATCGRRCSRCRCTEIDPATNEVVRQWFGAGGDAVRVGHGSVWLSNLREQNVWRIDLKGLQ